VLVARTPPAATGHDHPVVVSFDELP
jgi:hypothetical protein